MRLSALIAIIALLTGGTACSRDPDPVEEAKARVTFLETNGGTRSELCDAQRAVEAAYLERRDAEGYRTAKLYANIECRAAELGI